LERKEQVRGLVGIASAPDFTQTIEPELNAAQKREFAENGVIYIPDCYGDTPFAITQKLIDDGNRHLLLHQPIPLDIPVRLIHGVKDADVPWQVSQKLLECLVSKDVTLTLIKEGNHRISKDDELNIIFQNVRSII